MFSVVPMSLTGYPTSQKSWGCNFYRGTCLFRGANRFSCLTPVGSWVYDSSSGSSCNVWCRWAASGGLGAPLQRCGAHTSPCGTAAPAPNSLRSAELSSSESEEGGARAACPPDYLQSSGEGLGMQDYISSPSWQARRRASHIRQEESLQQQP